MAIVIPNTNFSLRFSLTYLKVFGLWPAVGIAGWKKILFYTYSLFIFMLILGTYIAIQLVDLWQNWGNLSLMTSIAFVLCTNLVHCVKIFNLLVRRRRIEHIIDRNNYVLKNATGQQKIDIIRSCNRGTTLHLMTFLTLTTVTLIGFAVGPALESQNLQLPLQAWYPYDWSKSPAYELTYLHQICAIYAAACLNISKDMVVVSLLAQCRCRFKLLGYDLKTLCLDMSPGTMQIGNFVRMASIATYLLNMMEQVFIYCYEGNELAVGSENISRCAYEWPWYTCSVRLRRSTLILMTRCGRTAMLTAGGFTTLSLDSFMRILKASYTFFTVLRQVSE
ncbi:odorant receptor 49b-like [Pieris napi]|uniref:odorant receptor 49b-like n=1 Tax=Pieris napi TaxID=78633 RepID=UPI001FB86346|nr:odorant receptor 49b-like [Pieris napi]